MDAPIDLDEAELPRDALDALDAAGARELAAVPVRLDGDTLTVAVADPHGAAVDALRARLPARTIVAVRAPADAIGRALWRAYGPAAPLAGGAPELPRRFDVPEAPILDDEQIARALQVQHIHGGELTDILVELGFVAGTEALLAIAARTGATVVHLEDVEAAPEALALLPADVARARRVVPVCLDDQTLVLAMADPGDRQLLSEMERDTDRPITPVVASPEQILAAIDRWYGPA